MVLETQQENNAHYNGVGKSGKLRREKISTRIAEENFNMHSFRSQSAFSRFSFGFFTFMKSYFVLGRKKKSHSHQTEASHVLPRQPLNFSCFAFISKREVTISGARHRPGDIRLQIYFSGWKITSDVILEIASFISKIVSFPFSICCLRPCSALFLRTPLFV